MLTDDQDTEQGFFLSFLRWLAGWWTQTRLSEESGIPRSNLNKYEKGKKEPRPATLRTITATVGVPERLVGFLRFSLRLIHKALSTGRVPPADQRVREEAAAAAVDILERAMALARAECALLAAAPRPPGPMTQQERKRAEALFEKLSSYPLSRQQFLIRGSRAYKDPFLALLFCEKSEEAAPHDPDKALQLAEQALYIAQRVEGPSFRARLEGWCTGFIGNVQRSMGKDLQAARKTFDRAWRLWRQGEDPAGLLSEAHLLAMEASLRRH